MHEESTVWPCVELSLSQEGTPFQVYLFLSLVFQRLFRVYAHIYHVHFAEVIRLQEEAHLNTSFKHFIYFVQEFGLIEKKELAPLAELIDRLVHRETSSSSSSSSSAAAMHMMGAGAASSSLVGSPSN